MKQCKFCLETKDFSFFRKAPRTESGYISICSPCFPKYVEKKAKSLDIDDLKKHLSYDPETGIFTWIKRTSSRRIEGQIAGGTTNKEGYHQIQFKGVLCRLHRLAWFYVHGEWPDLIDHINGIKSDNRISNLRKADRFLNMQNIAKPSKNNKLGIQGVHLNRSGKYEAKIYAFGKNHQLGRFEKLEDAALAYQEAKKKVHSGVFENGVCELDATGKVVKGPSYFKPDLAKFLRGAE